MAKISRRMAIDSVHKVLRAYQKKIEDGRNYTEHLPYAGRQIVKRYKDNEDNYKTLLNAAAQTEEFFTGIDDETLLSYVNVCHELNKIFDLKVSESRKIKGFREETYYFEAGILYLDARGTGITISDIFPEIFLETSWNKDRKFYTDICRECLGITDPNFINGEYKVNLKFDGNDDTEKDNKFGVLMRKKYITDRFIENGEAGVESGRKLLIEFDSKHGTKICKSENDYYNICERIYKELIPSKSLIPSLLKLLGTDILMIIISFSSKDIISAIMILTILYALLEPYIKELEKKIVTTKIELQNCVQNWIKYIKKFHIEKIDDFDMNQGEIMGFIKAVSVLVSHIPDNTNVITYTGGIGLSVNWLEELAYRCFERGLQGGCTALKNNLIEIFEKNKDNAKNVLKITGETLKNNIIVSTVIEWLPDNIKSDLSDTFNVEELSSIIDKTALKIANNKGDLEKYEKTYIHKLAGFMYTNSMDDYYYTEEGSLQSKMGFMDYYDECGKYIGMAGLQDIVVIFPYDDKEYRVEFWYGPYADGRSLGAEIGVYYRSLSDAMEKEYKYKAPDSKFIFYDCVKDATDKMRTPEKGHRPYYNQNDIKSDQFVMTLTMYMNDIELYSHTTEGHTGKEKDDDHFWCLAIRSSKLGRGEEKKLERKKMKIIGTLQKIDDPKLMDVMSKALREARISGKRIIVNYEKSSSKIEVLFGGIYETD